MGLESGRIEPSIIDNNIDEMGYKNSSGNANVPDEQTYFLKIRIIADLIEKNMDYSDDLKDLCNEYGYSSEKIKSDIEKCITNENNEYEKTQTEPVSDFDIPFDESELSNTRVIPTTNVGLVSSFGDISGQERSSR